MDEKKYPHLFNQEEEQSKLQRQQLYFTFGIAGVVIVGGMVAILALLILGIISGDAGLAILGPLIGAAVFYVFQKDAQKEATKARADAAAQGAELAVTPYPSSAEVK